MGGSSFLLFCVCNTAYLMWHPNRHCNTLYGRHNCFRQEHEFKSNSFALLWNVVKDTEKTVTRDLILLSFRFSAHQDVDFCMQKVFRRLLLKTVFPVIWKQLHSLNVQMWTLAPHACMDNTFVYNADYCVSTDDEDSHGQTHSWKRKQNHQLHNLLLSLSVYLSNAFENLHLKQWPRSQSLKLVTLHLPKIWVTCFLKPNLKHWAAGQHVNKKLQDAFFVKLLPTYEVLVSNVYV